MNWCVIFSDLIFSASSLVKVLNSKLYVCCDENKWLQWRTRVSGSSAMDNVCNYMKVFHRKLFLRISCLTDDSFVNFLM